MNASVIDTYVSRTSEPLRKAAEEPETLDDLGAFSILRGVRDRALMLELRLKDGSSTAFSYAYLTQATFDPSEGIVLHFPNSTVRIIGTNLGAEIRPNVRLFQSIIRHRVAWIHEADSAASLGTSTHDIVIDELTIEP